MTDSLADRQQDTAVARRSDCKVQIGALSTTFLCVPRATRPALPRRARTVVPRLIQRPGYPTHTKLQHEVSQLTLILGLNALIICVLREIEQEQY